MIETSAISLAIIAATYIIRTNLRLVRRAWSDARPWERAILVLALMPIPGPVDELLGVVVLARIARRRHATPSHRAKS